MKTFTKRTISLIAALATICSGSAALTPSAADLLKGDVTGDGKISIEDAQNTLDAYADIIADKENTLSAAQISAADVDSDKKITVVDAQLILIYYVQNTLAGVPTTWDALLQMYKPVNRVPDEDKTLSILGWTDDDLSKMIKHFTEANPQYQNQIRYVNVGSSGGEARDLYASFIASGADADLYMAEPEWIREYTDNSEYSCPITDLGFRESDFDGCYPYTLAIGKDTMGELKAVSWQACPGGYVYRSDLAKKYLGVNSPEEMQPLVKDWDAFADTAKKIKGASDGKTVMAATASGLTMPWMYGKHSALFGEDNKLQIGADTKTIYDRMESFIKNGYVTNANQWTDQWYEIGQDDTAFGYFFSNWCLKPDSMLYCAEGADEKGKTYGLYNITEGPAPWYWGGIFMTLSSTCNSGTAAHDFIEHFVINQDTMASYAKQYDEFVNNSAVMQTIEKKNPLLGGQSEIAVLDRNAKALDLSDTFTSYENTLAWNYYDTARNAILNGKTYDDAVEDFKDKASDLLRDSE